MCIGGNIVIAFVKTNGTKAENVKAIDLLVSKGYDPKTIRNYPVEFFEHDCFYVTDESTRILAWSWEAVSQALTSETFEYKLPSNESKKVVYYSLPISLYNTPQEQRDVKLLESLGFEVFNPNTKDCEIGYKTNGMSYFESIIKEKCHFLFFRSFPDGAIPAGIAKEIEYAKEQGLGVFELPSGISRRTLTVDQTRETLCELGKR